MMVSREDSLKWFSLPDDHDEGYKEWLEQYGKLNSALFAKEVLGTSDREAKKLSLYKEILDQSKGQIIFYGPPGTGKTHTAKLLAQVVRGERLEQWSNTEKRKLIQFHPSYSYEDFVQGIKPKKEDGEITYKLQPGIFQKLCLNTTVSSETIPPQTWKECCIFVLLREFQKQNMQKTLTVKEIHDRTLNGYQDHNYGPLYEHSRSTTWREGVQRRKLRKDLDDKGSESIFYHPNRKDWGINSKSPEYEY
jgi:DNA polymerase III delta prime subunit